jgi:hypothetical protein
MNAKETVDNVETENKERDLQRARTCKEGGPRVKKWEKLRAVQCQNNKRQPVWGRPPKCY